jgi:hypothetical protein
MSVDTATDITFTGTYASYGTYPYQETAEYYNYIHYRETDFIGNLVDVVYPINSNSLGLGTFAKSNVKIIGQVSAGIDYGNIITHG